MIKRSDGKLVEDWSRYLNTRCLVIDNTYSASVREVKVLEVSPSGKMVKLKFQSGNECWEDVDDYLLVELLTNPYSEER